MFSTLSDIISDLATFFTNLSKSLSADLIFFLALAVEAGIVVFFVVKSLYSYESSLNRTLDKANYWLFQNKFVTEDNIKDLNMLFKARGPKRLCYYWQQYILFREGPPSSYLSTENLIEKPLKTSSFNSNIKNLTIFTVLWSFITGMLVFAVSGAGTSMLSGNAILMALLVPIFVMLIGIIFIVFLRARKNVVLNSLYQNTSLFGRFMDNACVDLPTYIDYQILFTPQEIENGQPVLREFLDYKARKEKEEFNKAKENEFVHEEYDFSATGVDGSLVLDRAMRESELFLKKKEKILLQISQLEAAVDSRRKNFDNVQKEYQTKIQASKENIERLRQMQEETTNRIESNYYRKQQTQEIGKQEQYEQEFEQQRAKYLLEKNEGEEEIAKLNAQLEADRKATETAMLSEYQTFFNKFCTSAEKVVAQVFKEKLNGLYEENEKDKQYITTLEIKLKNTPDAESALNEEGKYDKDGNYVYANGTFFDKDGNFHDERGNVYSQDGKLIFESEKQPEVAEKKEIVDLDDFNEFDFMNDVSQKGDVYEVAEKAVNDVDENRTVKVVNKTKKKNILEGREVEQKPAEETGPAQEQTVGTENSENKQQPEQKEEAKQEGPVAEKKEEEKKEGQPVEEKPVKETTKKASTKSRGRPTKTSSKTAQTKTTKGTSGRPKKIVKEGEEKKPKLERGRPKKTKAESIEEINKRLSEEEERINKIRASLNQDLEKAMNEISTDTKDENKTRREKLIKEITKLQSEAQNVIQNADTEDKIAEINAKLEKLLDQIQKLG